MHVNPILNTDSYKISHYLQYPPRTEYVSSYIEARQGLAPFDHTVFFGLQAFLMEYLEGQVITRAHIDEAESVLHAHGMADFNRAGWEHIVNVHDGKLPLRIAAVPEGTVVPNRNVLVQVTNTDPEVFWLTSYVETALLRAVWYGSTVATLSHLAKAAIRKYLSETADDLSGLPFKLHDFGFRGVSSWESGMLGGMGHLVNFMGTDTLASVVGAKKYYDEEMAGFSIPAAEHGTVTSWGREGEEEAYANMLQKFGKKGALLAVVSDSYDIYAACDLWGTKLKEKVVESGATLVIRPDSGEPTDVTLKVIERLGKHFGCVTNGKGYKVLQQVRIIQGDSVDLKAIEAVLENYKRHGWSADNIAFGMGGALLQQVDRDTLGFSMKASAICVDGVWREVYKAPVTAAGKVSRPGRLALVREGAAYATVREEELGGRENMLRTVYENGTLTLRDTLGQIRQRSEGL